MPEIGSDSLRTDANMIDEDIVASDRKQSLSPTKPGGAKTSQVEVSSKLISSPNKTVDISENLPLSQSESPAKKEEKKKEAFTIPADEEYEEEPFEEEYI